MNYSILTIALLLVAATLLGGAVAQKLQGKLNYLLGFVAGLMLGVVAFDLLPEVFELTAGGNGLIYAMVGLALGFIGFHFIEQMVVMHSEHEEDYKTHAHSHVGKVSIYALILHRLLDGLSIGVAFKLNFALGIAVSTAIIAHSFTDGLNLVSLAKLYKQDKHSGILLGISALAPLLGIVLAFFIALPPLALAVYLAVFAGFLMYLAAADILPSAHREKARWSIMLLTLAGLAVMLVIKLVS